MNKLSWILIRAHSWIILQGSACVSLAGASVQRGVASASLMLFNSLKETGCGLLLKFWNCHLYYLLKYCLWNVHVPLALFLEILPRPILVPSSHNFFFNKFSNPIFSGLSIWANLLLGFCKSTLVKIDVYLVLVISCCLHFFTNF